MHFSRSVPARPAHAEVDEVPPAALPVLELPGAELSEDGAPPVAPELELPLAPPLVLAPLPLPGLPLPPLLAPASLPDDAPVPPLAPALAPPLLPALPPLLCAQDAVAKATMAAVTAVVINFSVIIGIL